MFVCVNEAVQFLNQECNHKACPQPEVAQRMIKVSIVNGSLLDHAIMFFMIHISNFYFYFLTWRGSMQARCVGGCDGGGVVVVGSGGIACR